jgi:hypothetical protein
MKPARLVFYGLAALIVILLLGMLVPVRTGGGFNRKTSCLVEISDLETALKNYHATYSNYPTGENSNIVRVLAGNNLQKIVFLNFRQTLEHPNEMVDAWGTPYAINFLSTNSFVVSSAGKDKKFGDADDIIFNSLSNDFVKP